MISGRLDRRIVIQQKQEGVNPDNGETIFTWQDVASCAAEFVPDRGQEMFSALQKQDEVVAMFRIRYRAGIVPEMRIVYEGTPYDITAVTPMRGRKTGLELWAKTGLTNG